MMSNEIERGITKPMIWFCDDRIPKGINSNISFKDIILEDYNNYCSINCFDEDTCEHDKKLQYFCDTILDIATYDDTISIKFAKIALDIMKSIMERKTFDFIEDKDSYFNFIMICNILIKSYDILEWGTSIRGCWYIYDNEKAILHINNYLMRITEDVLKYILYDFFKEEKKES